MTDKKKPQHELPVCNDACELSEDDLDGVNGGWTISGDADDRPTEEVAFYYNKIAVS